MNNEQDAARHEAIEMLCSEGAERNRVTRQVDDNIKSAASLFSARAWARQENRKDDTRTKWHEKVRDQSRALKGTLKRMQRERPSTLAELVGDADLRYLLTETEANPLKLVPLLGMLDRLEYAANKEAMQIRNKRSSRHDRAAVYGCLHTFQRFLGGNGTRVRRAEFSRFVEKIYIAAGNPPDETASGAKARDGKSSENRTAIESAIKRWHQKQAEN